MLDDTDEDTQLIHRLASAMPTAPAIDPLAIAFESGRRAGARSAMRWRVATGVSAMCAIAVGAWPREMVEASPSGGAIVASAEEPIETTPEIVVSREGDRSTDESILALRQAVLDHGLDGLPYRAVPVPRERTLSASSF